MNNSGDRIKFVFSQKIKQFEGLKMRLVFAYIVLIHASNKLFIVVFCLGLCYNNLNSKADDKFPTTVDDLQGFWDMVYLQIDQADSIFRDIEELKANNWKVYSDILTTYNFLYV